VPVCQAVQHAHQKGIIHRDLKPSNVLVAQYDGRPVPKVIDFGIAKATGQQLTEHTLVTGFGAVVGTLEYMSPEQAELNQLDIDTRSDVYSLGVLLYELLTGTTPLERSVLRQAGLLEALRLVREAETPRPSARLSTTDELPSVAANRGLEPKKLSGLVRGELDWIVMKALEKDRNRRYETANGFAADVQRYLADEPVLACPPSAWYRLRKFLRRYKGPVLAAGLLFFTLSAGILGTTLGMIREEKQRMAAENSANEARSREAETNGVLAFVENRILGAVLPGGWETGQGYDVKLADALKAALPDVDKRFVDQPLIEARLRMVMGNAFWHLGEFKTASDQQEKAFALYTQHRGPNHLDTILCMNNLAYSYASAGRTQEALNLFEETLEVRKATLGPDHRDTLRSMNSVAERYLEAGRMQEALKLFEETLQLRKATLGPDDPDTLLSMNNLALGYERVGRAQESLKLYEETLQLRKATLGDNHAETLVSMNNLANAYSDNGRGQEALKLREETLPLMKAKMGPNHLYTLMCMNNLAEVYAQNGRSDEALKLFEETFSLMKDKLGANHPTTLTSMNNLANAYADKGRLQEAIKLLEETLRLRKGELGSDHPDTLWSMHNLATFYHRIGELAKARALLQDTLALRERRVQDQSANSLEQSLLAQTHGQLGEVEQARMDYAAAVRAYARSVELFEKLGRVGALKDPSYRERLNLDRQRLALCRKAEQAVTDLDFALRQPAAEVPGLLDMRVRYLLKEQRLAAAVESAVKIKERAGVKPEQLYDAACAYAICDGAAKQAKSAGAGTPGFETLTQEAMILLSQAVAKGYTDAAHMKQDKDLDALRERADFQKLLAELATPKKDQTNPSGTPGGSQRP
jgi:tetratricopeptide (TPR) repeat protein